MIEQDRNDLEHLMLKYGLRHIITELASLCDHTANKVSQMISDADYVRQWLKSGVLLRDIENRVVK